MSYEFKVVRRVEFADTDMAGIVHYSNFFRYMEMAEHGFFRALGHSVVMDHFAPPAQRGCIAHAQNAIRWPRRSAP